MSSPRLYSREEEQQQIDRFCELASDHHMTAQKIHAFLDGQECKINTDGKHSRHKTCAVDFAAQSGNQEVLAYLIEFLTADLNYKHDSNNILEWAMENNNPEVLIYLLSLEDLPTKMNDGTTQLHIDALAARNGQVEVALRQDPHAFTQSNNTCATLFKWARRDKNLIEWLEQFGLELAKTYLEKNAHSKLADVYLTFSYQYFHDNKLEKSLLYSERVGELYRTAFASSPSSTLLHQMIDHSKQYATLLEELNKAEHENDFFRSALMDFLIDELRYLYDAQLNCPSENFATEIHPLLVKLHRYTHDYLKDFTGKTLLLQKVFLPRAKSVLQIFNLYAEMALSFKNAQQRLEKLCNDINNKFQVELLADGPLYAIDPSQSKTEKSPYKRDIAEVEQPEQTDPKRQHAHALHQEPTENAISIPLNSSSDSNSDEAEYEPTPLMESSITSAQHSSITSPFWRANSAPEQQDQVSSYTMSLT